MGEAHMNRENGVRAINLFGIILVFFAMIANNTYAVDLNDSDSCRCEGGIISIGDTKYDVKEKCGDPKYIEEDGTIWVYDFGPTEFVYYITFGDGRVRRIQFGFYGQERSD